MFGYIIVNKPEMKFREFDVYHGYYCGLCRKLKEHYGKFGQITLSYARRRTCNTICAMAQASRTTATAPPTGQPKAGESVRWFISSTSKPMPARPSKRWPRPVSTIREHPPWRPCCSTRFHGSAEIRFP